MLIDKNETLACDVLVAGGGGAGLRAAIASAEKGADVLLTSKARIGQATNTYLSMSVIASSGWGNPGDNGEVHARDTILGGRRMNNPDLVARLTGAVRPETALLKDWGVAFVEGEAGGLKVMKTPGHSHARHIFSQSFSGRELVLPLKRKAEASGVRFLERVLIFSLLLEDGRVCGAVGITGDGTILTIKAGAVILATGGFGGLFEKTNNAPGMTGDGLALALEAGASLTDMEFVQFYPTATGQYGNRILLYERVLVQDGARLKNSRGEDILAGKGLNPAEITRDELAQLIMKEIIDHPENQGAVDLDLSGISREAGQSLVNLLPTSWSRGQTVFRVTPTTHFCMGGLVTDLEGKTSCQGLYAAGEVAAGAHGANRLGGNALAEIVVMGAVAGKAAAEYALSSIPAPGRDRAAQRKRELLAGMIREKGLNTRDLIGEIRKIMWEESGIIRDGPSLERAIQTIAGREDASALVEKPKDLIRALEYQNMRLVGLAVCRAALERTESRGAHFRTDFPRENDRIWLKNIRIRKTGSGLALEHTPADPRNIALK